MGIEESSLIQLHDYVNLNLGMLGAGEVMYDEFSWAEYYRGLNQSSTVVVDDGTHIFAARFPDSDDPNNALLLFSPIHPHLYTLDTFESPNEPYGFAQYVLNLCKDVRTELPASLLDSLQTPLF